MKGRRRCIQTGWVNRTPWKLETRQGRKRELKGPASGRGKEGRLWRVIPPGVQGDQKKWKGNPLNPRESDLEWGMGLGGVPGCFHLIALCDGTGNDRISLGYVNG